MSIVSKENTKIVIIEDEQSEADHVTSLIRSYFPDVQISGRADTVLAGTELISKSNPNIVILDIQLKDGTSFELLEKLNTIRFKIIWTTAWEEYAIRAFRISAVDFLLKPYKTADMVQAIMKAKEQLIEQHYLEKIETLINNASGTREKQMVLNTSDVTHIININDIIRCEADSNYTEFFLVDNNKIVISKPLKFYDELLSGYGFFRIQQSHLVNLRRVKKVIKKKHGSVMMENSDCIPLAQGRLKNLLLQLDGIIK